MTNPLLFDVVLILLAACQRLVHLVWVIFFYCRTMTLMSCFYVFDVSVINS